MTEEEKTVEATTTTTSSSGRDKRESRRSRSRSRERKRSRDRRSRSRSRERDSRKKKKKHKKKSRKRSRSPAAKERRERRRKRREGRKSNFTNEPPPGMVLHGKTLVPVGENGDVVLPPPSSGYVDPTTKPLRELYFGNIRGAPGMDQELKAFIEKCFSVGKLLIMSGCPVQNCRVSEKFAFVEFRSIQETNNAMNLNGSFFNGKVLSVARTKSYTGPVTKYMYWGDFTAKKIAEDPTLDGKFPGIPPPGTDVNAATSGDHSNAPGSTRRLRELYLGNVPENITDIQLKQFIGQAMEQTGLADSPDVVKACRMGRKFAFVEFVDEDACAKALNLTGIPLLNCDLRFGRPKNYDGVITQHGDWNEVCSLGMDGLMKKYPGMLPSTAMKFPIHAPLPIPIRGGGVVRKVFVCLSSLSNNLNIYIHTHYTQIYRYLSL